jgi:ABC-type microcin C transport system permease subunit YejB
METALWKIILKNGSIYNVFCANQKQNNEFIMMCNTEKVNDLIWHIEIIEKGIHTKKQWDQILTQITDQ